MTDEVKQLIDKHKAIARERRRSKPVKQRPCKGCPDLPKLPTLEAAKPKRDDNE
jgi:hypothetical protein